MAVLDKGKRNVEILKQPQYSPLRVEQQIAIIFCGTNNLLRKIPVNKIVDFQTEYLHTLEEKHDDLLGLLKAGKYTDEIISKLNAVARQIAARYE